ncbi:DUF5063 domain-containing protein [Marinifilum caeruleilacunae]|uniref:DUF5063 domain-containing protein n=1 Tax=Marinifilum caeruleilacunae TaxID=2499076 RepID=A0ABX1WU35_9BACT|nr:DUF5063 domain-containing protein [Marinifilum caeruleilacunae]NOU59434.1 DUF5063 domain-containing protein [Marinifilum caeruleilacunae]
MEDKFEHVVYSKNVIEFVTVANEFCLLLETSSKITKLEFVETAQKLLPLLYLKASMLPANENELDDEVEKFVTESDWEFIHSSVKSKMGAHNEFLEVFENDMEYSDTPLVASISENFADIYQDLKDFITSYKIGTVEVMNDALWDLNHHFYEYWGQKLVNSLRAIHKLAADKVNLNDESDLDADSNIDNIDMSGSIFSQRQREWGEENE